MIRLRRVLYGLSVCTLSAAMVLTGCSTGKTTSPNASSTPQATAAAKPVTLKWLLMGTEQKDSNAVWAKYNEELQKVLPNTTVNFQLVASSEYAKKWQLLAASGEDLDLAWTGWLIDYNSEISKGAYIALDDLIDKYAPDMKKELPSWLFDIARYNGKIYAVPCYQQMTNARFGVAVPKDLSDKYWTNLADAQKLWYSHETLSADDFNPMEQYLQKLKDNNALGKGAGLSLVKMAYKGYYPVYGNDWMVLWSDKNFKATNIYLTPEIQTFYAKMADWYQKGFIRKDVTTDTTNYSGKGSALWLDKTDFINTASQKLSTLYGVPVVATDFYNYAEIKGSQSNTSTAISANSKNPDRAMQVMNLMNSAKGKNLINMLSFGIEGTNYTKVSDNKINTIGYNGTNTADAKAPYGLNNWVIGNVFNSFETQSDLAGERDYVLNTMHTQAKKSTLTGFKFDTKNVTSEIAQYNTVVGQYATPLMYGVVPNGNWKDTYNEFVTKLKAAGIDKIISELQKQEDEFLKTVKK